MQMQKSGVGRQVLRPNEKTTIRGNLERYVGFVKIHANHLCITKTSQAYAKNIIIQLQKDITAVPLCKKQTSLRGTF